MEGKFFRIITLGSYSVGKTSLLLRASEPNSRISQTYMCTIGVDFKTKTHMYKGREYKLRVWDTAGQERFMQINRLYFKDTDGVLLVYDIGSLESFDRLELFLKEFKANVKRPAVYVLVGNKNDCEREISEEKAQNFANKHGMAWVECSAMTGDNIERVFDLLVELLLTTRTARAFDRRSFTISDQSLNISNRRRCC